MKNPDHIAFEQARTVADKRLAAIAAYEAAREAPEFADWIGIADMLRSVIPTPKAKANPASTWVDDPMPRAIKGKLQVPKPVLLVRFVDGRSARATALTVAGKPVNWGRGVRQAIEFYRGQVVKFCGGLADIKDRGRHVDVPEIESVTMIGTGEAFDVAEANRMTVELRAGCFNLQTAIRHAWQLEHDTEFGLSTYLRTMYILGTKKYGVGEGLSEPSRIDFDKPAEKPVQRGNVIRGRFMRSTALAGPAGLSKLFALANCA